MVVIFSLASNNCFSYRNVFQNDLNVFFFSKLVNHFFVKKLKNLLKFGLYNFVQISPACGINTYDVSNSNIKYPLETSIFAVKLTLKLFRVTVADADIGSLKSLHTFLKDIVPHARDI